MSTDETLGRGEQEMAIQQQIDRELRRRYTWERIEPPEDRFWSGFRHPKRPWRGIKLALTGEYNLEVTANVTFTTAENEDEEFSRVEVHFPIIRRIYTPSLSDRAWVKEIKQFEQAVARINADKSLLKGIAMLASAEDGSEDVEQRFCVVKAEETSLFITSPPHLIQTHLDLGCGDWQDANRYYGGEFHGYEYYVFDARDPFRFGWRLPT